MRPASGRHLEYFLHTISFQAYIHSPVHICLHGPFTTCEKIINYFVFLINHDPFKVETAVVTLTMLLDYIKAETTCGSFGSGLGSLSFIIVVITGMTRYIIEVHFLINARKQKRK